MWTLPFRPLSPPFLLSLICCAWLFFLIIASVSVACVFFLLFGRKSHLRIFRCRHMLVEPCWCLPVEVLTRGLTHFLIGKILIFMKLISNEKFSSTSHSRVYELQRNHMWLARLSHVSDDELLCWVLISVEKKFAITFLRFAHSESCSFYAQFIQFLKTAAEPVCLNLLIFSTNNLEFKTFQVFLNVMQS